MIYRDLEKINKSACIKAELSNKDPKKYMLRSIMAGFYLLTAIILSYVTGAVLNEHYPGLSRISSAATFSVGIIMILYLGGELFTGNNLIMAVGVLDKKIKFKSLVKVWLYSYIGNFIGCFILGFIFVKSGASFEILKSYLQPIIEAKLQIPPLEMFLRGVLCNFMVCAATFSYIKLKSDVSKIFIIFWLIMSFVIAGFEHSIANMGIFTIAAIGYGGIPLSLALKSMFIVTLGNIVGGSILLAYPLKAMSVDK